jgi:hypothetical protein
MILLEVRLTVVEICTLYTTNPILSVHHEHEPELGCYGKMDIASIHQPTRPHKAGTYQGIQSRRGNRFPHNHKTNRQKNLI